MRNGADHIDGPEIEARRAIAGENYDLALKILMDAYKDVVYGFCRMRCDALADVCDAAQLTFFQAWLALPKFSSRSSCLTWLIGIAKNRCADLNRERRRRGRRIVPETHDTPVPHDDTPSVERRLIESCDAESLQRCIKKLTPAEQVTVYLRFMCDMSYEEIGIERNERESTLRARISRALRKLRGSLTKSGDKK